MHRNTKAALILWLGVTFMYLLASVESTILHEEAHAQIGIHHGCVDADITYNFFNLDLLEPGGQTVAEYKCNEYVPRSDEDVMQEKQLHMVNEIVSYNTSHFQTMFALSIFVLGAVMIILTPKKKEEEEDGSFD